MEERTRLVVQIAMTEYMILMSGALLLYLALFEWPHAIGLISLVGGILIAGTCLLDFLYLIRNYGQKNASLQNFPKDD